MNKETTSAGGASRPMAPRRRSRAVEVLLQYGTVLALIVMIIIMSFLSPVFLTVGNMLQILLQAAINLLMALGMTFVILTAGIDLSVGSTAALAGLAVAALLKGGLPWPLAALAALGVGLIVGLINGSLIAIVRITPFIVTLGMLSVVGGDVASIPMPAIIALVAALISWLVLRYTRLGEYTYAMGGNEEATRLSGVDVRKYKIAVYVICAVFAALAGVVLTARLGAAEPIAATGYELNAIAATVMGGTSLFGGEGGVGGTIIGALIIATLINGLNLMNVQAFYQQLAIGLVIILAVVLDRFRA